MRDQHRKVRLELTNIHVDSPQRFWENNFWTVEKEVERQSVRSTLFQNLRF